MSIFASAGILILTMACGRKAPRSIVVSPPAQPAPSVEEHSGPEPLDPKASKAARLDILLGEAELQAAAARRLYTAGEANEGRRTFDKALDRLRESGFEFSSHPRLERAYYRLLDEFQRLELKRLAAKRDFPVPEVQDLPAEASPMDEVSEVNLFTIEVDPELRDAVHEELLDIRFDFPIVLNDSVLRAMDFHRKRGRKNIELGLKRLGRFKQLFEDTFEEFGLPKDLIYMSYQESLFNPRAYSRAHAKGLWQFTTAAGRDYGLYIDWWVDQRSDIVKSTRSAALYLKTLHEMFGDWYLVLAAYNSGPGRIQRVLKRHGDLDYWQMCDRGLLPRETRTFVPLILSEIIIFRSPQRFGFQVEPDPPLEFEEIEVEQQVELKTVARLIDVPPEALAALNPELRRGITPYRMADYRLKVPPGTGKGLRKKLAELPAPERVQYLRHQIRRGETLGQIARRYSTSIDAIAQMNGIRNVHRIRDNQVLLIPTGGRQSRPPLEASPPPQSGRYIVRSGDSLYRIARRYNVKVSDLMRWNNLHSSSVIFPGQAIRVSPNDSSDER